MVADIALMLMNKTMLNSLPVWNPLVDGFQAVWKNSLLRYSDLHQGTAEETTQMCSMGEPSPCSTSQWWCGSH